VQAAFFAMPNFQPHVEELRQELAASTKAALNRAFTAVLSTSASAGAAAMARKQLENARAKAKPEAINRSIFSHCIFELEDSVLQIIDGVFFAEGWTVSSLQYDGMHVEHHTAMELRPTMANAVAAVKSQLGYDIDLTEKPLFGREVTDEALQQEAIARGEDGDDE
jgi:hypothetical protein